MCADDVFLALRPAPARLPSTVNVKNGRYLITDLQTEAATMPLPRRADIGVLPEATETSSAMLAENPELDEFVARCLAQLRKVMDGLQ